MGKRQPSKKKGVNPRLDKTPKRLHDPTSYDDANFSWRVHDNYIDYEHPQFGWGKVEIIHFLRKVVQVLQSYEGLKWHDVKRKPHCHPWGLDEIPQECYARLEERQIDIDELFQIGLGNKPRIIGYKTKSIFYLMWYDPDHKFCPTKAR
jgi:hypothetical protein